MTLKENTKKILQLLPKRMQDVLARRFGLTKSKRETLEAVGVSYGITRERVRQIEAHALELLQGPEAKRLLAPFIREARLYFERGGGVRQRDAALAELGAKWHTDKPDPLSAEFVLEASRAFLFEPETFKTHSLWAVDQTALKRCREFIEALVALLGKERRLLLASGLSTYLARAGRSIFPKGGPGAGALRSYLAVSKRIGQSPFGLYGLTSWPEVRPRGVRDYAYVVFYALKRPLHFRELALEMNGRLALKHPAHEQTVHNELIKDPRFVLVGRGVYALKEWGYEVGTVREVLTAMLARSGAALTREEIMEKIKTQRLVKENTVFFNLQNRQYFVRLADGRYTINN